MERLPLQMRAIALERFGGIETLKVREVPVPAIGPEEVLIRIAAAGVGSWDPFEREGGYAELQGTTPAFPYVLGSEGAGVVAAAGERARDIAVGDEVYAASFLNPRGGFYAEYAAVPAGLVAPIPAGMSAEQAGALGGAALTALRGLDDVLALKPAETVLIVGAGGGIGHLAVQIARRLGARVLALASGSDGVALATQLGCAAAADGRTTDAAAFAAAHAPDGLDAALLTAGGAAAEQAVAALRAGGRAAYPTGVMPEPPARADAMVRAYNGEPDAALLRRLTALQQDGPLTVHVARSFALEQAAEAHRALGEHYLGKLVLRID